MSRVDHKGNSHKPADHLRLYRWLTDSDAWQHLTTNARALYVLFKTQYRGNNNGRLILSVRQAADGLHIGKTTAANAFDELMEHGFIEVVILGSFSARKDGRATEWRLTEHACDVSGELASKRFMRWQPKSVFTVPEGGRSVPEGGQSVPQGGLSNRKIA